jgi:hypothetical protein
VFLGYDWESWRAMLLLALATVALGVVVGFVAYLLQDKPEDVTCGEMLTDFSKRTWVTQEVAEDLDIEGLNVYRVARITSDEIDEVCAGTGQSYRPVNSDLRGSVRQQVDRLDR